MLKFDLIFSAPTVTLERIPSGTEAFDATEALLKQYPGLKMAAQAAVSSTSRTPHEQKLMLF